MRKAKNEPDETKRKKIMLLVDEDKKKLEKLYEKKKNIALSRLGEDFNASSHVQGIIEGLKDALERNNNPRGYKNPRNPNCGSSSIVDPDMIRLPSAEYIPIGNNSEPKPFLEKYWKELLLLTAYLLGSYYILNQPEDHE